MSGREHVLPQEAQETPAGIAVVQSGFPDEEGDRLCQLFVHFSSGPGSLCAFPDLSFDESFHCLLYLCGQHFVVIEAEVMTDERPDRPDHHLQVQKHYPLGPLAQYSHRAGGLEEVEEVLCMVPRLEPGGGNSDGGNGAGRRRRFGVLLEAAKDVQDLIDARD